MALVYVTGGRNYLRTEKEPYANRQVWLPIIFGCIHRLLLKMQLQPKLRKVVSLCSSTLCIKIKLLGCLHNCYHNSDHFQVPFSYCFSHANTAETNHLDFAVSKINIY